MPKISVIVPVYKVEPYIHRCIDSILAQTFTDFELILVDDGSPDNCGKICDEYAAKDGRIHVIHQDNGGLSAARNTGIDWAFENSDSEWITFIDSDDWVHTEYLERMLNATAQYQVPVSCCCFQRVEANFSPLNPDNSNALLRDTVDIYCSKTGNGIDAYPCRFLFQKKLFDNIRFPCGKVYEDIFTTYKLIFQTPNIAELEQGLYFYFYRQNSLSHASWDPRKLDIIEAYEDNLHYFASYPSQKLLKCLARGYLIAIHAQFTKLQSSSLDYDSKRRYKELLRRKQKSALRKYAKIAGVHPDTDGYLYSVGYPTAMKLYWLLKSQLRKILHRK